MLSICPIFRAAPRIRQSVDASRSALSLEATGEPTLVDPPLPSHLEANSVVLPHAKPTPKDAKPTARPNLDDGTARPSFK